MIFLKKNKQNKHEQNHLLSDDEKKQYLKIKIEDGLTQLRFTFICFMILYGLFGYLDYLLITEYLALFYIIRFGIVIPSFILFLIITFHPSFYRASQYLLSIATMLGGGGIAFMLILYPDNFSYYGGLFMVIFSSYFLVKMNTKPSIISNIIVLLFFVVGYVIIHGNITFEIFLVIAFLAGSSLIGALGNYQLESMGKIKFLQSIEIKNKNEQLQAKVIIQHNELLQIEKAFESTSDAMAIFDPLGKLRNSNSSFQNLYNSYYNLDLKLEDILSYVLEGHPWDGEIIMESEKSGLKTILVQADCVYEDKLIIGAVATCKDITDRKIAEEHIQYIGYHDQLTGLFNRHWFEEEVEKINRENELPISIIMADLNGLKLLNDTYGHSVGDEFLIAAAKVLKKVCRKVDLIARWGGDEFLILLPQTLIEDAKIIADRIHEESLNVHCKGIPLSMAIGVACKKHVSEDMISVMKVAEDMMYRQKLTDSRSAKSAILNALNRAMEVKSYETEAHSENMQDIARRMGSKLGLSSDDIARLDLVIRLHDIGKINIPTEILGKNGPLDDDEWVIMKKHSEIGYRIAQATEEFAHVATEILSHHEKWDGTGYPQKLNGNAIPYLARIATIIDSYEVMLNGRHYKDPMPKDDIIEEMKRCSGSQFDPNLIEVFLEMLSEESADPI